MAGKGRPPGARWSLSILQARPSSDQTCAGCYVLISERSPLATKSVILRSSAITERIEVLYSFLVQQTSTFVSSENRGVSPKNRGSRRYPCVKLAAKAAYCASGRASAGLSPY